MSRPAFRINSTEPHEHDEIVRLLMDPRVKEMDGSDYNEDLIQLVFKYCPFNYTIRAYTGSEIIGFCQLCPINVLYSTFEVAWHFKPEVWGKGYGTEVSNWLINCVMQRLNAESVSAKEVSDANKGSIRLLEKNRFEVQEHHPEKNKTTYVLTREKYFQKPLDN